MYTILYAGLVKNADDEAEFHARMEEYGPLIFSTDSESTMVGFNNADVFGREHIHHAYAEEDFLNRERLFKADGCGVLLWRKMVEKHARGLQTRETANFARRETPAPAEIRYSAESGGL